MLYLKGKISNLLLLTLVITSMVMVSPWSAMGKPDYAGMVEEIEVFFKDALRLYKEGDKDEAKLKAQSAYFEVFENMEGPIRINVSAKKNFALEEQFVTIRNMIKNGEPVNEIEKSINTLMTELREVLPELEGGFVLKAEAEDGSTDSEAINESSPSAVNIEPLWQQTVNAIEKDLQSALDLYKAGDVQAAKEMVLTSQYRGYKNTMLETSVRLNISQKQDYANNSAFADIYKMIGSGADINAVEQSSAELVQAIRKELPGLPIVELASSPEGETQIMTEEKPVEEAKDWSAVSSSLFKEIERALALNEKGEQKSAVIAVQDAYFDIFEGSGMEGKIGARDADFKSKLESHFSMIVGQLKKGVATDEIRKTIAAMKTDFASAVAMLSDKGDSPAALFFYSLMIILREGIEAILIITAIIAYLVKTNNQDKLGSIYNGCIAALVVSVIMAVLVKWVFHISAASQEIIEGVTMLLAAVVLFSVSYWLISKAEAKKWMSYIKGKVSDSLSTGSVRALWFVAFLAVFREGAETVLFYEALSSGADSTGIGAIAGGFVLGSLMLIGIYYSMKFGAIKLPIKQFFMFTGGLLYFMAFVFAGKGVMELIEGKLVEPSLIGGIPTVSIIGLYPYWQTILPQALLVFAALTGLTVILKKKSVAPKEA